jgi:putative protease
MSLWDNNSAMNMPAQRFSSPESANTSTGPARRPQPVSGDRPHFTAGAGDASTRGFRSSPRLKPELLAPAGDKTCLLAAVENGADAVYFGLKRHNARIRAMNFDGAELADVMSLLHRRGARGYVTLNTLVFPDELADVESSVRELVLAGVDAVIIQDLGLASLIRAVSADLEIHASTQMWPNAPGE